MTKKNQKSASVLVFSLIVLFILTTIALGIASVSVVSRKMASTTGKSVGSFQVADSGAEIVLQKIYKDASLTNISSLASSVGATCASGALSGSISSGKNYSVIFYKPDSGNDVAITDCGALLSDITKLKSTGEYGQTSRAVEVAVAAAGGGCYVSYSGSCLSGFTNKGSAGSWGSCDWCPGGNCNLVHFLPAGGNCDTGWKTVIMGAAAVCCL
ncbi:MAG: hypothetical protein Q7S18_03045 [bacterium]|nr:hypothetical protein [bacterium]